MVTVLNRTGAASLSGAAKLHKVTERLLTISVPPRINGGCRCRSVSTFLVLFVLQTVSQLKPGITICERSLFGLGNRLNRLLIQNGTPLSSLLELSILNTRRFLFQLPQSLSQFRRRLVQAASEYASRAGLTGTTPLGTIACLPASLICTDLRSY